MILHTLKNHNAVGFDSPNLFVDAFNIMDSRVADAKEKELYVDVSVPCDTIDHLFYDMKPSLLKINALAADLPILSGAERTCKKYAPSIVMDYGVRPEYIHETILFLKQCRDDYRFFCVRRKYMETIRRFYIQYDRRDVRMEDKVREILREINPFIDITNETNLLDEGVLDSLGIVYFIQQVEETMGIKISLDSLEVENFETLNTIIEMLNGYNDK